MSAPRVLDTLQDCLRRQNLLRPGACLVAAVSGGSDSMALLAALYHLQQKAGFALHVCHVQHGLRGGESLLDEQLVRDTCRRMNLPVHVHNAELGGDLHLPGMETRARNCRRAFYADTMASLSADALLLAHHQEDQAETLLMHLLRGAGSHGLGGMLEAVPFGGGLLLRPFLPLSKEELRAALLEWGIPYREDASNQEALTPRNALRLNVLPELERLFPGCTGRMARAAGLLRQDDNALGGEAYLLVQSCRLETESGLYALFLPGLQGTPAAVAVRALRQWVAAAFEKAGITRSEQSLSAEESEALLTFALGGDQTAMNLPGGLQAYAGSRWLYLLRQDGSPLVGCPQPEALPLDKLQRRVAAGRHTRPLPGWEHSTIDVSLHGRLCTPDAPPDTAQTAYVPVALVPGCVLRTPQPGDTIQPLGAPGGKPLRRYLTDCKMDLPFRPHLPVLAQGSTILWIPGLCTAKALAYQPDTPCLCLTLTPNPPYLTTRKGDKRHG